tara:strand:- start:142 stop:585 length:444 start_codon:yes stop_codon:yes gene_type:complete
LGKLQKLVMNYKLSNRELMLIKLLAAIGLITIFIYGTSYLATEINKSKEYLFIEVNKFNEKKQTLSQIKAQETNKKIILSLDDFLIKLTDMSIQYEQNDNEIVIKGLSSLDALQIITDIETNNADVKSFILNAEEPPNIILSINFNG